MAKKNNWSRISKQQPSDTTKFRDVYEDQQLERSKIQEKQSPTSRIVFVSICTILVMGLAYFMASVFSYGKSSFSSSVSSDTTTYDDSGGGGGSSGDTGDISRDLSLAEYAIEYGYDLTWFIADNGENVLGYVDANGTEYTTDELQAIYDAWLAGENDVSVESGDVTSDESSIEEQDSATEVITETTEVTQTNNTDSLSYHLRPTGGKLFFSFIVGVLFFVFLYQFMMRNLEAQNLMNDTADINQYQNDQHIALPEEIQRKFDWFPDVGAHSNVQFSSMISHMALSNKGLKKIKVAKRADKDILDENGNIEYYKGEVLLDENGDVIYETKPFMDEKFMEALFDASGLPKDKNMRKYYDTTKIPYNPDGSDRDKLGKFATVADLINEDWVYPSYETQRPAGAYIVDTAPVNTMV